MVDKKILKEWIAELKKFTKEKSSRRLRFPMFMESPAGDLLSPEGILCNLHAKATKGKWLPEEGEGGKLRGYISYGGKQDVAPDSVLKWIGISAAKMSEVRRIQGEHDFEGVIKHLEEMA